MADADWQEKRGSSYLYAGNAPFIEALYDQYLSAPDRVDPAWRAYFDALQLGGNGAGPDTPQTRIEESVADLVLSRRSGSLVSHVAHDAVSGEKQAAVLRLIRAYRLLGHLRANVDPIRLRPLPPVPDLDPYFQGLSDADRNTIFSVGTFVPPQPMTLDALEKKLKRIYTGSIGLEYIHINDIAQRRWLEQRFEGSEGTFTFDNATRRQFLRRLTAAEGLEQYLHVKYVGQKRFSLEGGESLITLLDTLIEHSDSLATREVVIGMAHRGRLNVLINLMGKMPNDLFSVFEGKDGPDEVDIMSGDVKYHEGFSADYELETGDMHVALAFNPSHLEIINPVVAGAVRSRVDRRGGRIDRTLGVLIHGDASFWGQGVVYETFNLTQTRGYSSGGLVHIVVNNRIGFTLSNPLDFRSTLYCTDIGKVVQAPILHVNADDPEACAYAMKLALDFRAEFKKDVIIDLVCIRRHGHNEADEPSATQPMMYQKIGEHPGTRKLYADRLEEAGVIAPGDADRMVADYRAALEANESVAPYPTARKAYPYRASWPRYFKTKWDDPCDTTVPAERLKRLGVLLTTVPDGFELHPRVAKLIDDRRKMASSALPMDWGCAENLAYASLLDEGHSVRLSGQDSGRGTFFHRHAVLHNQRTGEGYIPLANIKPDQPLFTIIDSILSEEAALAFEYGYAMTNPEVLVIWEAQFGDFVNGAQVVIDQFISSSEQKWRKLCGLVLMLPHGWEGQGPEHTSARLERFLQLCAQDNMQVCAPTTPAQMFHMLRRELIRAYRKPLIIMSPKSMLRRKASFSELEDLAEGGFQVVIGESDSVDPASVKRVILCSGKVYYDLDARRQELKREGVAIVRLEQLYPFPKGALIEELEKYPDAPEVVWAQEEPMNQGAWYSIQHELRACMLPHQSLSYAGRLRSASPSGGHHQMHVARQRRLVDAALNLELNDEARPIMVFHPLEPKLDLTRR